MVFAKSVRKRWVVALARVPDVLRMMRTVRIRLNGVVGVSAHEEPVNWAALAICKASPIHVLSVEHCLVRDTIRLLHHGWVWLQIWSIVPSILAAEFSVSHLGGKKQASYDR